MPQAPQFDVVSSASQKPEQQDMPAMQGCAVSQPVVHWLSSPHTWVAAQSPSPRHWTQTWLATLQTVFAPASAPAQSALDLHPAAHVVPVQYVPTAQLSDVGRHCTQVLVVVSHRGVVPEQSESIAHSTHPPALQTWPVGHGWVAEHPSAHVSLGVHTNPAMQSPGARQATHAFVVVSHLGVGPEQVVSSMHATHTPAAHTLPGLFTQSALLPQPECPSSFVPASPGVGASGSEMMRRPSICDCESTARASFRVVGIVAPSRAASLCEASSLGAGDGCIASSPLAQLAAARTDARRHRRTSARRWIDESDGRAMGS
jgi:hypothetical protein